MNTAKQLSDHLNQVFTGGNWTFVNIKDTLGDVTLEEASKSVQGLNSIKALAFHIAYYLDIQNNFFEKGLIEGHDKESWKTPEFTEVEWESFKSDTLSKAERLCRHFESVSDNEVWSDFSEGKYGNYFRNMLGITEHTHYHLGQISLIKKLVRS